MRNPENNPILKAILPALMNSKPVESSPEAHQTTKEFTAASPQAIFDKPNALATSLGILIPRRLYESPYVRPEHRNGCVLQDEEDIKVPTEAASRRAWLCRSPYKLLRHHDRWSPLCSVCQQ